MFVLRGYPSDEANEKGTVLRGYFKTFSMSMSCSIERTKSCQNKFLWDLILTSLSEDLDLILIIFEVDENVCTFDFF